jgi:hypothetical protein
MSDTTDERTAMNPPAANRVVIGKQIAGRTLVGQAPRLLVAAALRAAFGRTGRSDRIRASHSEAATV